MAKFVSKLEEETDRLLRLWVHEYAYRLATIRSPGAEAMALTETRGYRSRRRSKEEGSARVHAVESRVGKKGTGIYINSDAARVEKAMVKLKAVDLDAFIALSLNYQGHSLREIGPKVSSTGSETHARRCKDRGFAMVMMELH